MVRLEDVTDLPNNAPDIEILEWAVANKRAVLSLDDDFRTLHYQWMGAGKTHNGIFLGTNAMQGKIGIIVNFIVDYERLVDDVSLIENDLISIEIGDSL